MVNMDVSWKDVMASILGGYPVDEGNAKCSDPLEVLQITHKVVPRSIEVIRSLTNGLCRYSKAIDSAQIEYELMDVAETIIDCLPDECIDTLCSILDKRKAQ